MATAANVISRALKRILVEGADVELQADEYADAIDTMNDFMLDLDANGYNLGYTVVTSLSDEVTIPPGAIRGLVSNLALEIAPDYNGNINGALVQSAEVGLRTMQQLGISVGATPYPSTLPIGTGNYEDSTNTRHYYPCPDEEILAETTGAIAVETGTKDAIDGE